MQSRSRKPIRAVERASPMQRHIRKDKQLAAKAKKASKEREAKRARPRRRAESRAGSAHRARLAEVAGRPDRDRQGGRSRPRGHRPAEAHGRRLPGDVPQRQGQAQPSRHHQPVRRHERHQQDVRLEDRRRARAQARRGAAQAAQAGRDLAGRGAVPGARRDQAEGREQVPRADPAHDLRAGADRRLRHPLRHRRRNSMAAPTSATTA